MKYIVTGGLGFIGSEVCRQLLSDKYPETEAVYIIDDNSKGYGTTKIKDIMVDDRLHWFKEDLSEQALIEPGFDLNLHGSESSYGFGDFEDLCAESDYIINCAAKIGGIGYFNKIPATILDQNNLILSNIFNTVSRMARKQRPHITYMSSSMVFESAVEFPSAEEDLASTIIPVSAYGFSKLAGEFYCKSYAAQYDVRYTIVRPFNAVGPEKPDPNFVGFSHVLPDFVCKMKKGQGTKDNPLEILGNGKQMRHYTDVREIAEGLLIATHSPKAINEDFNIAISKGHSVLEVANLVWSVLGDSEALFVKNVNPFACDVQYRSPSVKKAESLLGWKATATLDDNILEIVRSVEELLDE